MPKDSQRTLLRKPGRRDIALPRNCGGLGSKSSVKQTFVYSSSESRAFQTSLQTLEGLIPFFA